MPGVAILKDHGRGRRVTLESRVSDLEERMQTVEANSATTATEAAAAHAAATAAATAAEATKEAVEGLLTAYNATKTAAGFIGKHYPRAIAFGTGIAAAAGWGNPKVIQFISSFFA